MLFAGILAGGSGRRMRFSDLPKQFLILGDKPVIIHTVEKFLAVPDFSQIYVGVHPEWQDYFEDLVQRYLPTAQERICIVAGAGDRAGTLRQILEAIEARYGQSAQHAIVSHDAVRPFVDVACIEANIRALERWDMVDTVIPATDTIIASKDGEEISAIPPRQELYQGQTPQTFRIRRYLEVLDSLSPEEEASLTDACKVFTLRQLPVGLVPGAGSNIKLTSVVDLKLAYALIDEQLPASYQQQAVNHAQ